MYIISKKSEKDYYDGVAGTTGIDKTIVYDRHIMEVEEKDVPKIFIGKSYIYSKQTENSISKLGLLNIKKEYYGLYPHISSFIIGFCGKFYPGWKMYNEGKSLPYGGKELITTISYDDKEVGEYIAPRFWSGQFDDNVNYTRNYDPIELFRLFNTPVFVYDYDYDRTEIEPWRQYSKFLINPLLKEYEFYKIFDAVQAFQEISMFIGGVLGNKEKEIINVADKYKIAQHGFDKWSFRKEPQKK